MKSGTWGLMALPSESSAGAAVPALRAASSSCCARYAVLEILSECSSCQLNFQQTPYLPGDAAWCMLMLKIVMNHLRGL